MGNAELRDRRLGISRPGPQVRAVAAAGAAAVAEEKRLARNEQARICQRKRRARAVEEVDVVEESDVAFEAARIPERTASRMSNKLARAINDELRRCHTLDCKRAVMEKLLNHNSLWPLFPEYYNNPQESKSTFVFLESYRTELQSVKNANSRVFLARKGALLDAAVSEGCDGSRALGRLLGVHPRNIYAAVSRRIGLDPANQFQLLERAKRVGVSPYVKEKVMLWWTQHTRVSPNKKDVTRKRIRANEYVVHATHYLTHTQTELFLGFRDTHPECRIKKRAFECLKPWYVKTLKDQNTCCCIYHVEMDMMKQALFAMRDSKSGMHTSIQCTCTCDVCGIDSNDCKAHSHVYDSLTSMWVACVCPKGELDKWHRLECLMGSCQACGVSKFDFCPHELSLSCDQKVKWKCFSKVSFGVDEESGQQKKRIQEVFKETAPGELVTYLRSKVRAFVTHNFVANWQDGECRKMMENLPVGVLISHIDFAENYSFAIQNEVQSMHWFSTSITILVHITFYRIPPVVDGEEGEIVKHTHYYISDDKKHDSLFVQHCLLLHWDWMLASGVKPTEHWVYSDGCAAQFKGAKAMYFVARYPGLTGCSMRWNFFGSGHGKGEWDGAGAVVKRALRTHQIQHPEDELSNAQNCVNFLKTKLSHRAFSSYEGSKVVPVSREFWHIANGDVDRSIDWGCRTITGSRQLHSILGASETDPTLLLVRDLSCFCAACIGQDWSNCEQQSHVRQWRAVRLRPYDAGAVQQQIEAHDDPANWSYGGVGAGHGDLTQLGDNFMIPAEEGNEENVKFYILQCVKAKFEVQEDFHCPWSGDFRRGEYVICGTYYQKWGAGHNTYVLLDKSKLAYVEPHLVRACKFPMVLAPHQVSGNTAVYKLGIETENMIKEALTQWWA